MSSQRRLARWREDVEDEGRRLGLSSREECHAIFRPDAESLRQRRNAEARDLSIEAGSLRAIAEESIHRAIGQGGRDGILSLRSRAGSADQDMRLVRERGGAAGLHAVGTL